MQQYLESGFDQIKPARRLRRAKSHFRVKQDFKPNMWFQFKRRTHSLGKTPILRRRFQFLRERYMTKLYKKKPFIKKINSSTIISFFSKNIT